MSDLNNNENTKLWDMVSTTNPNHTKPAQMSGQKRTTVKAVFQKEKATSVFGAQGQKWGVVPKSEEYTRLHLESGEIMLQYTAIMYYIFDGERGEIPLAAAIMEAAIVKRGKPDQYLRIDHEAIKKVRTDAATKGLSELGFNADIFKGWYDDPNYMEYASAAIQDEEFITAQSRNVFEIGKLEEFTKNKCMVIAKNAGQSLEVSVRSFGNEIMAKAKKLNVDPTPYTDKLNEAYLARIEELNKVK